ncbi:MAG TPA: YqeG family HAD IIIA-type phosphatase [Thermotogota bacterium]|jgi:hypothetical protein|nr:YqeG family HAD IIIA-type phosphatase [Thermotogota bacterium]NLH20306.1 YqeG family HAD IIIA-type phosphatase [Thermotogaceae bacterium]OQC31910.1 MAG: UMP phosphatase [Thermotogota bacterium ADurb.Bin062]HNW46610.1 YqeG family HAD IIIA-type phosphatase [Thermotogota bacterium]HNY82008.1 YqeG family HAD IIIA-type phosphatase [Thermotogota bacterium]
MNRIRDILSLPTPKDRAASIWEIDYDRLYRQGFRFLFFDYDNTLAPWKSPLLDDDTKRLFSELIEKGFSINIISNAPTKRVAEVRKGIDERVGVFGNMRKPGVKKLRDVVLRAGAAPSQSVLIGDLFFTDIIVGNRLMMHTFLVNPYMAKLENATKRFTTIFQNILSMIPVFFYKLYFYTIGWFFRLTHLISPHEYARSVFSVDYEQLALHRLDAVVFDLDNTLLPRRIGSLSEEVTALFTRLQRCGFRVFILSNTWRTDRLKNIEKQIGEGQIIRGKMLKPFPYKMRGFLKQAGQDPKKTVIIGDQLFTDILCGNLLHLYTIKVEALDPHDEYWTTKILRFFERRLISFIHFKPKIKETGGWAKAPSPVSKPEMTAGDTDESEEGELLPIGMERMDRRATNAEM